MTLVGWIERGMRNPTSSILKRFHQSYCLRRRSHFISAGSRARRRVPFLCAASAPGGHSFGAFLLVPFIWPRKHRTVPYATRRRAGSIDRPSVVCRRRVFLCCVFCGLVCLLLCCSVSAAGSGR